MNMMLGTLMAMTIIAVMSTTHKLMSKSSSKEDLKTPFECGFSSSKNPEMPFSVQFFMVTVMFIIFDIEISLILSMMKTSSMMTTKKWMKLCILFMLTLQITLMYEMSKSSMKWMK